MNNLIIKYRYIEAGSWAQCTIVGTELDITKKNFGLIHVYFLYTVFRVTYRTLISKGYMTTKLNIAVGEALGNT